MSILKTQSDLLALEAKSASAPLTKHLDNQAPQLEPFMASVGQDLEGLFASLRPSGTRTSSASHPPQPTDESSASNIRQPLPFRPSAASSSPQAINQPFAVPSKSSPFPSNVNARNFSQNATMSNPPASAGDQATSERTNNLLNLLKFGSSNAIGQSTSQQSPAAQSGQSGQETHTVHGRGISASDLVGSIMGKSASPLSRENVKPPSSMNHQDVLLKLLNRSASSHGEHPRQPPKAPSKDEISSAGEVSQEPSKPKSDHQASRVPENGSNAPRKESPIRYFGTSEAQPTPFQPQDIPRLDAIPKQEPLFTYVNPFEQLAASSPRNGSAATPSAEGHKRKSKRLTPEPSTSRRKISPAASEVLPSIETPSPIPQPLEGRSRVEALMGIGAPTRNAETVAEALNEVGNKVDQEAEKALAKAEEKANENAISPDAKRTSEHAQKPFLDAVEEEVRSAANQVKNELDKEENKGVLEQAMPAPVAEAVKDIIDDAAEAWESDNGGESPNQPEGDRIVRVYQFPLKPFVSIDIKRKKPSTLSVREDAVTHIARFRKDFDQIDRTLGTASNEFIAYGSPKPGGLRLIRQDDGLARHLFNEARDRIFNISLSATPTSGEGLQTVLATGVSGTVYWATIMKPETSFLNLGLDKDGLIIPPTSSQVENVSGGQLKTRAKKTSRHPEVFAIGRGKAIHIIFPYHAARSEHLLGGDSIGTGHTLDTEKYLKERNIKIVVGKAGKDFAFSEDDSVIVSLDKVGRLGFWDVTELLNLDNGSASKIAPMELKTPVVTFATASSGEKSWPTSVMLVDKLRPYTKGIAQRYVLVGLKQNHTLQLWDLCLLKAVQELNFPHDSETDAICSVAYHPSSGIIVVGHPTRNSIYFIHLSAPRYNLPSMSQARFLQRLAQKDSTLPRPEATAIMSGLREYSFDTLGHIRSIDLVSMDGNRRSADDEQDPPLFELYVLHSRGVTSLSVDKADLGWSRENKVIIPVDAEKERYISVKDLRELSQIAVSEPSSVNGDHLPSTTASATAKQIQRDTGKSAQATPKKGRHTKSEERVTVESTLAPERTDADLGAAPSGGTEKGERKKKKKRDAAAAAAAAINPTDSGPQAGELTPSVPPAADSKPPATQPAAAQSTSKSKNGEPVPKSQTMPDSQVIPDRASVDLGISGEFLDTELKKIEHGVSAELKRVFSQELETLYRRFDDDKRVQSAAGAAKQDAMLRLVSATLGENVEKSLSRIIESNIREAVIPAIIDTMPSALDRKLSEILTQQLHNTIPTCLKLALPEAISRGVQNPDVFRILSEQLTEKLGGHVERELAVALHKTIMPAFQNLTVNLAQKVSNEAHGRLREHFQRTEVQHHNDSVKIDQLTELVRGLSETVHAMAAAQSEFQQEILKLQQQVIQERRTSSGESGSSQRAGTASRESTIMPKSPEQEALDSVSSSISAGRLEEGTIQWLQSEFQNYIFDGYLAGLNPGYLRELSPLLNLSVGAAVTSSLDNKLGERLTWLEAVFSTIRPGDPELREYGSRIMDVLRERLESGFMQISMSNAGEPALRRIPPLANRAREFHMHFR
ncbi:MAG: hypothetical protein Q9216_000088 [Gyalolechia sp. 2 TL-2023]